MNIAGQNIDMSGIGSGIMGTVSMGMWAFGILIILGLGAWLTWSWIYNKKTFIYPVTLTSIRENGTRKTLYEGIKGGIITKKDGVKDFAVKMKGVSKKKSLGYVPDFSLADIHNRLHFMTSGDNTLWQQVKEDIITEIKDDVSDENGEKKEARVFSLVLTPIPTDIKTATINNIHDVENVMEKNKVSAFTITIIGFIIMVIAHLISLYAQTKLKCGTA